MSSRRSSAAETFDGSESPPDRTSPAAVPAKQAHYRGHQISLRPFPYPRRLSNPKCAKPKPPFGGASKRARASAASSPWPHWGGGGVFSRPIHTNIRADPPCTFVYIYSLCLQDPGDQVGSDQHLRRHIHNLMISHAGQSRTAMPQTEVCTCSRQQRGAMRSRATTNASASLQAGSTGSTDSTHPKTPPEPEAPRP